MFILRSTKDTRNRSFRLSGPRSHEMLELRQMLAITVVNLDDAGDGSLRAAIEQANTTSGPDYIDFAPGLEGSLSLKSGQLEITDDVTIVGPGADRLTISGDHQHRVFVVGGANVNLSRMTVANGVATDFPIPASIPDPGVFAFTAGGGGLLNIGGNVTLKHMDWTANRAANNGLVVGGAIANVFGASLDATHVGFRDNSVSGLFFSAGGAILNDAGSSMSISHGQFHGNLSANVLGASSTNVFQGGAVGGAVTNAGGSHAKLRHTGFHQNSAIGGSGPGESGGLGGGGGVVNSNNSLIAPPGQTTLFIHHSEFVENRAIGGDGMDGVAGQAGGGGGQGNGGALNNDFGAEARVVTTVFHGNVAQGGDGGRGGAGANGGSTGAVFDNNGAGGAVFNVGSMLSVVRGTFTHNRALGGDGGDSGSGGRGGDGADAFGGAIANAISFFDETLSSTVMVNQSAFLGNQALGGAGGNGEAGSGVGGNALGGALQNGDENLGTGQVILDVKNSLIVSNLARGGDGGSTSNGGGGLGAGIYVGDDATVKLKNTPVTKNTAIGGNGLEPGAGIGGGVYNLGHLTAKRKDLDLIFDNVADLFPDLFDEEL